MSIDARALLAAACLWLVHCPPLPASDHADPILLYRLPFISERLEAGITDLFVYPDGDRLVVILGIRRGLRSDEQLKLTPYTYEISMDLHSVVSFESPEDVARYGGTVVQPDKIEPDVRIAFSLNDDGTQRGELDLQGLKHTEAILLESGVFDDPFIFPRFFGTNVVAMVLSIPFESFPRGQQDWLVWAVSKRDGKQIDHVGRSNRTMQPRFDFLNTLPPNQHVHAIEHAHAEPGLLRETLRNELEPNFAFREYDFAPDVMIFTTRHSPVYPNGRRLEDDVAKLACEQGDCLLYELSFRETDQGQRPTRNDKKFLTDFPYLAAAWEPTQPLPPSLPPGRHKRPLLTLGAVLIVGFAVVAGFLGWLLHAWYLRKRGGRLNWLGFMKHHSVILACGISLSGCAYNTQQRTVDATATNPAHSGEHSTAFRDRFEAHTTAYIEFDEQGDFWDRRQLASAVDMVRNAKPPVLLAIYAHGWQNHSQSADVARFNSRLLAPLAQTAPMKDRYSVVGVYLGWNGKKLHGRTRSTLWKATEVATPFTFWGRKNSAANRVAGTATTEVIFSVARAARASSKSSKVLMIGHSFGALVMERAVAQAMIGTLLFQNIEAAGDRTVVLPADLVVLMNSAAESIYAKETIDFFRSNPQSSRGGGFIGSDRPFIVSITSRADWATGKAFRIGTMISNLGGAFRHYPTAEGDSFGQRQFLTTTPGHNTLLASHDIVPVGAGEPFTGTAFEYNLKQAALARPFATSSPSADPPPDWWRFDALERRYNRTPYWIVRAPKEISGGHTDVWNQQMVDTLAAVFRIAHPRMTAEPAKMQLQSVPLSPMPAMAPPEETP